MRYEKSLEFMTGWKGYFFPDSSSLPTPEVFYSIHWHTCRNTHHYRNKHHCAVYYCVICLHKWHYTLFCTHFYNTFFFTIYKKTSEGKTFPYNVAQNTVSLIQISKILKYLPWSFLVSSSFSCSSRLILLS